MDNEDAVRQAVLAYYSKICWDALGGRSHPEKEREVGARVIKYLKKHDHKKELGWLYD